MSVRILVGDALERLRDLPDNSVHCVVTSPPYWGLRAYEGGDNMIGMEETFDEHLENLLAVFREVRRVLRTDGTLWLNYGDAYAGSWGNYHPTGTGGQRPKHTERYDRPAYRDRRLRPPASQPSPVWKPKDLMMMPARVAMALQADGWWLRSEIVWSKANPMPESVRDRPTNSHGSPAHAGIDRRRCLPRRTGPGFPRTRGDRPPRGQRDPAEGRVPPHTRG